MTAAPGSNQPPDPDALAAPAAPPPGGESPVAREDQERTTQPSWPGVPQGVSATDPRRATPFGYCASMGQRFGAYLLDLLIVGIPAGLIIYGAEHAFTETEQDCSGGGFGVRFCTSSETTGPGYTAVVCLVIAAMFAYYAYFNGVRGGTIGKKQVGIKIVDASTGAPIGFGRGAARCLIQWLSNFVILAGCWSPFLDSTGRLQGWHDRVAGDLVVSVR